jgi:type II restriction enzyme
LSEFLPTLIQNWRSDPSGTYQSWFLWPERLKNFRSIRRGLQAVVKEIACGNFGSAYRGSSLETVVHSVAEQRQIFKGADHAFLWKPKLRIPDIYENAENQRAFGQLLDTCVCCNTEAEILAAIHRIDDMSIKGLGPAVANLLYFLHPTIMPPCNTKIVEGYNALTGAKTKLGRWDEYLAMRKGLLAMNTQHRGLLSNDLGAIAGLMFDVGRERYAVPPPDGNPESIASWQNDLAHVRLEGANAAKVATAERESDYTHTEVQSWLRDLGLALDYDVWVASNDQSRPCNGGKLGDGCLTTLPSALSAANAVYLIDIIWIDKVTSRATAAFEVEHSTSIYSGILRMLDLALSGNSMPPDGLFLVVPDGRQEDVRAQLSRPAFSSVGHLNLRYISYGDLKTNRASIARFGTGMKAIQSLSKSLP